MPVDKFGNMSDAKTRDTVVSLTYINNNYIRSDGSTPVLGSTDMKGNTLYNVSDRVNPQDVATKEYADNVRGGGWVRKKQDGTYAIRRDLDMGFKKLLNLSVPSEPFEAATQEYVDKVGNDVGKYVDKKNAYIKREVDDFTKLLDYIKKTIDERPHIIVVHASYYSPLRRGEYQFTFGGNIVSGLDTGFLVPQSGRIKKIKSKSLGWKIS